VPAPAAATSVRGFRYDAVPLGESGEVTARCPGPAEGPPDGERGDGGQDCLRAAITARSQLPGAPTLVLSQYVEASHAADPLAGPSGAVGYLLTNRVAKVEEFLDAWTGSPAARRCSTPRSLPSLLAGQRRDSALAAPTGRERQLLALMAEGHANTAIGQRLVISASAVEKHKGLPDPRAPPARPGYHQGHPRPPGTAPQPRIQNEAQEPRRAVASRTPKTGARHVPPRTPSS
jgi:hypothetical protein